MSDNLDRYTNVVYIKNILKSDFEAKWDGKVYKLSAGETKAFPLFLGEHMAKHLVTKAIVAEHGWKLVNNKKIRLEYAERIIIKQELGDLTEDQGEENAGDEDDGHIEDRYEELKRSDLFTICASKGIPTSFSDTKVKLIERLRTHDKAVQQGA